MIQHRHHRVLRLALSRLGSARLGSGRGGAKAGRRGTAWGEVARVGGSHSYFTKCFLPTRTARGARLVAKAPFGKWQTLTFLAALRCDG
jgi:hypothetical protein